MNNVSIVIKHNKKAGAEYEVVGDKTDIKNMIYSLMCEDPVFASLSAIATKDYMEEKNISFDELCNQQIRK